MTLKGLRFAGLEFKNTIASKIMVVVLVAVGIIPCLYGALYLYAFLDPYNSLSDVPVAVVNEDAGATINEEERNVGEEVCNDIAGTSDGLQWNFVSADEAREGMEAGKYYMVCTIPSDFSENIASAETNSPERAQLQIEYNESKNMLASQIGETVWNNVQQNVNESVSRQYWEATLEKTDDAGKQIEKAAEGAGQLAEGASAAGEGAQGLTQGLGAVASGVTSLQSGMSALSSGADALGAGMVALAANGSALSNGASALATGLGQAESMTSVLPEQVNQLATGAQAVDAGLGLAASSVGTAKDPGLLLAGSQGLTQGLDALGEGLGQTGEGVAALQAGLGETSEGLYALKAAIGQLSGLVASSNSIEGSGSTAAGAAGSTAGDGTEGAAANVEATGVAPDGVATAANLEDAAAGAASVSTNVATAQGSLATARTTLVEARDAAKAAAAVATDAESSAQLAADIEAMEAAIAAIDESSATLVAASDEVAAVGASVASAQQSSAADIASAGEAVSANAAAVAAAKEGANANDAAQATGVGDASTESKAAAQADVESQIAVIGEMVDGLIAGVGTPSDNPLAGSETLFAAANGVSGGVSAMQKLVGSSTDLPSIGSDGKPALSLASTSNGITQGLIALGGGLSAAQQGTAGLAAGTSAFAQSMPALTGAFSQVAQGADGLALGVSAYVGGVDVVAQSVPAFTQGVSAAASGVGALAQGATALQTGSAQLGEGMTVIAEGNQSLADSLAEGAEGMDVSKRQITEKSEMMSAPVELEREDYAPVENYGTGFAPYFMALGLWVGCLVAGFVFRPVNPRLIASGANPVAVAFSGFVPLALFAAAQAVVLLLVLQFALGLQIENVPQFYAFGIFAAVVFAAILQFLMAAFGFPGRFVAIILLMLQLTSAAGTFPIETTPGFFQVISPFMPMTYVVEGMRQIMTGVGFDVAIHASLILLAFGVGHFLLTAFVAYRRRTVRMETLHPVLRLG